MRMTKKIVPGQAGLPGALPPWGVRIKFIRKGRRLVFPLAADWSGKRERGLRKGISKTQEVAGAKSQNRGQRFCSETEVTERPSHPRREEPVE